MARKLAVAIAILGIVALAAWFLGRRDDLDARAKRSEARLLAFDERLVTAVAVSLDGVSWRFERLPDGWRITAPIRDAAREEGVTMLLAALRRSPVNSVIDDPEALSTYGLAPARSRISLEGVDAPALEVGDATPTEDSMFARVEGRPGVLVIGLPDALPLLALAPSLLRDDTATGLKRVEIRSIAVETGEDLLRLEKDGAGWWIVSPRRLPADESVVEAILRSLEEGRVSGFEDGADPADPELGFGPGAVRVTLAAPDVRRVLTLGGTAQDGSRFAMRDDRQTVVRLGGIAPESLPVRAADAQARRLTKVNRYAVRRFAYETEGRRLAASRGADDAWTVDGRGPIDEERVYRLLVGLLEAPVDGWDDDARPGAVVGSLDVEIDGGGKERIEFLSGGRGRVASVPGATARLAAALPPVP